ncbi:IS110 family transposase [Photobacterium damselae]|uniref:IS110 family transposase n=1 Tax=Photobacterium damselae TaxID=38293 RepID=UPI0030F44B9D
MITSNILAIDLAKNVFQVCKRTAQGQIIFNREVSRNKLKELLIKESVSLVSMEACSSSHYWARYAANQGHHVKVISARIVKQKTDSNDALAIATAAAQEHIHRTRISTPDKQALQSLERVRNLAIAQQTAQSNQIRGLLAEFGIIIPQGLTHLRRHIPLVIEDAENNLPSGLGQPSIHCGYTF